MQARHRLAATFAIGAGGYSATLSVVTHRPRTPAHYKALISDNPGVVHATVEVQQCGSGG